ncbi:hypothetical protein GCM10027418_25100 [Mariniluteicoccus endophyticus]
MPLRDKAFKTAASARARSMNQWPLLAVIAGELVGLVLVWIGHWRWGAMVMGACLCVGAVLRLVLPRRVAGLLQVRGQIFDIVTLVGAGSLMMLLAVVIPPQS